MARGKYHYHGSTATMPSVLLLVVRDMARAAMVVDTAVDAMVIVLMTVMMIGMAVIVATLALVLLMEEQTVVAHRETGETRGKVRCYVMFVI